MGLALAQTPEADALREQMARDATRSLWAGADASYSELVRLRVPLQQADHLTGFEAARQLGRTADALARLRLAQELGATPEIEAEIARILAGWGEVDLRGAWRRPPLFVRERMPFGPDEQRSIAHAEQEVESTGSFHGLLPAGQYLVGDRPFEVVAGAEPLRVDVRRPGGDLPLDEATRRGGGFAEPYRGLSWAGAAIAIGPAVVVSPASGDADLEVMPEGTLAPGLHLRAGAELGIEGIVGLSPSLAWDGGFAGDVVVNRASAGLGLVLRPGITRLELGPAWGVVFQSGTGVTGTLDRLEDGDSRPNEALRYRGQAFGPGAFLSLGWTVGHMGPWALQLRVDGSWQGGPRNYVTGSAGIGMVPWTDRTRRQQATRPL